ncbi:heavy metal translocating P-type ATPase [Peptostreptococcus sp. D1]|uniref:heavy metal translocating P-type ATPase n=1 Tax=Peptostreptococcus sp. D1 TaxID=72304 RepID=UPI0008EBBAD1|nr:heavy metal translocating P-type ATPase [Peptostreptococcus sp. D1]SFE21899.1 Cd2+/Zn2+-exporting ATPase [Peptostreptococcus sp. D1]
MKVEIILGGLNCAHCAGVIEEKVKKMESVDSASLNFVSKKLIANIKDNENVAEQIGYIRNIIDTTEPGLKIEVLGQGTENNFDRESKSESCSCSSSCSLCSSESDKSNRSIFRIENEENLKIISIAVAVIFSLSAYVFNSVLENYIVANALFVVAYFVAGYEVLGDAIRNILKGKLMDENFLMSVATIGALIIGEYPEAVGVMVFYSIGELLESHAVSKSRKDIESLMDIKPDVANLLIDGEIVRVSPESVNIGDIIVVRVGEKVPLDGKIIKGNSMFDTSAITGESVLKSIKIGERVLSGVINKKSVVTIEVEKLMKDSTVSKILDMVENATSKKSKTENFISVFAKYYTPIVVSLALLLAIAPTLILGEPFYKWAYRGLVFLVVSCPCALVLSIPLTYFSGIGISSKNGILVKGSNYLEALRKVNIVVLDKTGTITKGTFEVSNVVLGDDITEKEIFEYARIAESRSIHPIATSIVKYASNILDIDEVVDEANMTEYEEISSHGVRTVYKGKEILAGNYRLMQKFGISYSESKSSSTKVHVAADRLYLGCIEISDEIKAGIFEAIDELKKIGIERVIMLTGDTERVASEVSHIAGFDEYHANLLPVDKVNILEQIIESNIGKGNVAFIGDGINDAPVIARSDVGISMGGMGSDSAIEASDIVFMTDEISKLPIAIRIAKFTSKISWQNIFLAMGLKIIVLIMSVFGLANMWLAIFADVGVAVLAVLNSLRVLKRNYR